MRLLASDEARPGPGGSIAAKSHRSGGVPIRPCVATGPQSGRQLFNAVQQSQTQEKISISDKNSLSLPPPPNTNKPTLLQLHGFISGSMPIHFFAG
jgi:hypothetical protein